MKCMNRKDLAKRQRDRERALKEQQAQLDYSRKIAEEAQRTAEAERLIQQLEQEELELIERLKKTQDMQKEVSLYHTMVEQNPCPPLRSPSLSLLCIIKMLLIYIYLYIYTFMTL